MGCLLASRLEEDEIVWAYRNIRRGPCISNNVTTDLFMQKVRNTYGKSRKREVE